MGKYTNQIKAIETPLENKPVVSVNGKYADQIKQVESKPAYNPVKDMISGTAFPQFDRVVKSIQKIDAYPEFTDPSQKAAQLVKDITSLPINTVYSPAGAVSGLGMGVPVQLLINNFAPGVTLPNEVGSKSLNEIIGGAIESIPSQYRDLVTAGMEIASYLPGLKTGKLKEKIPQTETGQIARKMEVPFTQSSESAQKILEGDITAQNAKMRRQEVGYKESSVPKIEAEYLKFDYAQKQKLKDVLGDITESSIKTTKGEIGKSIQTKMDETFDTISRKYGEIKNEIYKIPPVDGVSSPGMIASNKIIKYLEKIGVPIGEKGFDTSKINITSGMDKDLADVLIGVERDIRKAKTPIEILNARQAIDTLPEFKKIFSENPGKAGKIAGDVRRLLNEALYDSTGNKFKNVNSEWGDIAEAFSSMKKAKEFTPEKVVEYITKDSKTAQGMSDLIGSNELKKLIGNYLYSQSIDANKSFSYDLFKKAYGKINPETGKIIFGDKWGKVNNFNKVADFINLAKTQPQPGQEKGMPSIAGARVQGFDVGRAVKKLPVVDNLAAYQASEWLRTLPPTEKVLWEKILMPPAAISAVVSKSVTGNNRDLNKYYPEFYQDKPKSIIKMRPIKKK